MLSRVIIWPTQATPGNKLAPKGLPNTSRFCPGSPKQLPSLLNTETTTVAQHSEEKKHKRNAQKLKKRLCRIRKLGTQQEFVTVTKLTVSLQRGQGSDSASYTILASKDCQKYSQRDTEEAGQLIQDPVGEPSVDKVAHGRGRGQSHPLPTLEVSKSFRSYSVSPTQSGLLP